MRDPILCARDGAIATVTLNNPEKLNALSKAMWSRLGETMRALDADDSVRCIVLRGAGGKAFAAGADISAFHAERANTAQAKIYSEQGIGWMHAVAECRHPTLALIQGACVGGGLLIASQCDLRICNEAARFGVPVKNLGLTESESAAFWPIYDEYEAKVKPLNDRFLANVNRFAENYDTLSEADAAGILKKKMAIEKEREALKQTYTSKVAKALPANKALRYAQLETRIDQMVRRDVYGLIPLAK